MSSSTGDTRNESVRAAEAVGERPAAQPMMTLESFEAMLAKLDSTRPKAPIPVENGELVPKDFEGIQRLAKWFLATGMCPYGIDNEAQAALVIADGLSIGVGPIQALKNIMVVNNRTAIFGDLGIALVRRSGKCGGIDITFTNLDDNGQPTDKTLCSCTMTRVEAVAGEIVRQTVTRTYSVADAKAAKLWGKVGPKGPTPWVTSPKRMLQWRAFWFAARDLFADVLKGMAGYEEVSDYSGHPYTATHRAIDAKRGKDDPDLASLPQQQDTAPDAGAGVGGSSPAPAPVAA